MKGKVQITAHGRKQTALAAWRQVTGANNASIIKGTGLSDRTVAKALQGGCVISAGSASLLSVYTGLQATTVCEGVKLKAWSFDFDRPTDIDAGLNPADDAGVWNRDHNGCSGILVDLTEDNGTVTRTETRSVAWMLGDTAVVKVECKTGGYMLSRIKAVTS